MHTNPDLLALMALGEDVGAEEDLVHISNCPACRSERAAFAAVTGSGRRTQESDGLVAPRDEVWQRVSQELRLHGIPVAGPVPLVEAAAGSGGSGAGGVRPELAGATGPAARASSSRAVRAASLCLAAALALVVGLGVGLDANRLLPGRTEVAAVSLNALPEYPGSSGEAVVERDREGNLTLSVRMSSAEPVPGLLEVWLSTSTADRMIAVGYLQDESGRFPLPPDVDLEAFRLVDISQEPADDHDFRHSGKSMLRGKLPV